MRWAEAGFGERIAAEKTQTANREIQDPHRPDDRFSAFGTAEVVRVA